MITILGNGPVGLIVERICQLKHWDYRLIGKQNTTIPPRLILLTPNNLEFLSSLGFSIPIQTSYQSLRISSHLSKLPCLIEAKDYQADYLCHAIWIQDLVKSLETYTTPIYTQITSGKVDKTITLSSKDNTYETDLLIGCDGSNSISAEIARISYLKRPTYHCMVIPAHLKGNQLFQKHFKDFILAGIPHTEGSIIISSQKKLNITPTLTNLQSIVGYDADIYSIKEPTTFELQPKISTPCFQNNTLLLGNSALTIEPVTAQGLNHAISQLRLIHSLNEPNISHIAPKLHKRNLHLFAQVGQISSPHSLKQRLGFISQLLSPFFQNTVYQLGNPDE